MSEFRIHTDQLGRTVKVSNDPQRIISLVPSQTELLFDLGLGERVVGITKFCVHPNEWFRTKTRVGGTKKLDLGAISALKPDLIIANKEENTKQEISQLEKDFPVWVSDVTDLDSALEMIGHIGDMTNSDASELIQGIETGFAHLRRSRLSAKVVYLIWKNPYMAAGPDTFISDMLKRCGFENAVTETRYPHLTVSDIIDLNPDVVLLSSEPFPFNERHIADLSAILPQAEIRLVDGEMFSWYGSRLRFASAYFADLIGSMAR